MTEKKPEKNNNPEPQRLGSLFNLTDMKSSSSTNKPKETTIGGSQKLKFAPVVPSGRRVKKTEQTSTTEESTSSTPSLPTKANPFKGGRGVKKIEQVVSIAGPVSGIFSTQPNTTGFKGRKSQESLRPSVGIRTSGSATRTKKQIETETGEPVLNDTSADTEVNFVDQGISPITTHDSIFSPERWNEEQIFLIQLENLPHYSIDGLTNHMKATELLEGDEMTTDLQETTDSQSKEKEPTGSCKKESISGELGKIQIRKSGKIELLLGNVVFNLKKGSNSSFMQSLAAVDNEQGKLFDLGPVQERFCCIPEMKENGKM